MMLLARCTSISFGRFFVYLFLVQTTYTGVAHGASFDCNRATLAAERVVCSDVRLSKLDSEMLTAFTQALAGSNNPSTLRAEQATWLSGTRNRLSDVNALSAAYVQRIAALRSNSKFAAINAPQPARDVLGVRLGMTPDEARKALHEIDKGIELKDEYSTGIASGQQLVYIHAHIDESRADDKSGQDIYVFFPPSPVQPKVIAITRAIKFRQKIDRNLPSQTSVQSSLKEKYGQNTFIDNGSNLIVWLYPKSGSLNTQQIAWTCFSQNTNPALQDTTSDSVERGAFKQSLYGLGVVSGIVPDHSKCGLVVKATFDLEFQSILVSRFELQLIDLADWYLEMGEAINTVRSRTNAQRAAEREQQERAAQSGGATVKY